MTEKYYGNFIIMQIQSVTNTFTPRLIQTNLQRKDNKQIVYCEQPSHTYSFDNLSFTSALSYKDFLAAMTKAYKNKSVKNVILSTIADDKNYIGSGFNANAYNIPNIPNYILRIERKSFDPQTFMHHPLVEETQNSLAPNFGQYVASNGNGLFINKKVFGESHSLSNWSETIIKIENGEEILYKDAKTIFEKIKKLSEFPLTSFEDLAKKIKKLNKYTKSEIDIMNPNNLIVNNEKKELGIIDLWYKHSYNATHEPYNGIDSMINLMLDPFTHTKVYNKLNNTDKDILIKSSSEIIKKVMDAGEKNGLERTSINARAIYRDFDKRLPEPFALPSYEEFLQMYRQLL